MKNKKKITIIGPAHPYRGGIAAFNERLARQFQSEGHRVEIITFRLQYPSFLFPGKTQYTDSPAPQDLRITRRINPLNPFNWWLVSRRIRKQKPDIVLFRYWLPFFAPCFSTIARFVRKNKFTRLITLADNITPHERHFADNVLTRYFVRPMDSFVVMSREVASDLRRFIADKPVKIVPHPIYDHYGNPISKQEARRRLHIDENEKLILFFGFIRTYKGLDLLYKAMSYESVQQRDIKLLVAGEYYGNEPLYRSLVKRYSIQPQLRLVTQFIPDEEVKNYFCAADLVVQPYLSATQSGISQMAYHFEKPMIVTRVGGLPEMVPDGRVGYVVDVRSTDVANAIVRFYDENKEAEFVENIRLEKQRFSWDRMTSAILQA